ncbi:kinase [Mycena sanguinolenta]|nr:kinase [Mycena sanguinolenta]
MSSQEHDFNNSQLTQTTPAVDTASLPSRVAPLENGRTVFVGDSPLSSDIDSKSQSFNNNDFIILQDLGCKDRRRMVKAQHVPTRMVMARKSVCINENLVERKKILEELQFMHDCNSSYLVSTYGIYLEGSNFHMGDICICTEFMDKGSFAAIYRRIGAIDIDVVGKVAVAVLEGMRYLHDVHRMLHRDIRPSNILCNSNGDIKLCDFAQAGVFGHSVLANASDFITSAYMSPERIRGERYSVKSDIWSLGLTLIELAVGQLPFSLAAMSPIELLHQIVDGPAPRLPCGRFSAREEAFVNACLEKDPDDRPGLDELLNFAWIEDCCTNGVDMKIWVATV